VALHETRHWRSMLHGPVFGRSALWCALCVPHRACDHIEKKRNLFICLFLLKFLKEADSLEGLVVDGK
jgi:hypothetical protein